MMCNIMRFDIKWSVWIYGWLRCVKSVLGWVGYVTSVFVCWLSCVLQCGQYGGMLGWLRCVRSVFVCLCCSARGNVSA